jgi:hypothetical protein
MIVKRFDYLVCTCQSAKVTWVNGQWRGTVPLSTDPNESGRLLDSCPATWDFLNEMGGEGWELVAAYTTTVEQYTHQTMILKRTL